MSSNAPKLFEVLSTNTFLVKDSVFDNTPLTTGIDIEFRATALSIESSGVSNDLLISNTSFIGLNGEHGGALYLKESTVEVENSSFMECSALKGGAIYFDCDIGGTLSIQMC